MIGVGMMGADHVTTLDRSVSGAIVAGIADVDPARAHSAAATLRHPAGCLVTSDAPALIADPGIDAVLIASHDSTHAELILAAVRAGKPVLSEKPLTPSVAESRRLQAAVGTDSGLVSLGFMRRFDPGYTQLKAAVDGQQVGRPLLVHSVSRGMWSGPETTTESSLNNSAAHEFDVVPWLLGSFVVEVSWQAPLASSATQRMHDPQLILLRTADGVLSSCETFMNARYGYDIRCEVVGESGAVSLTEPTTMVIDRQRGRTLEYSANWLRRFADAYRLELQAWVDGLRFGTPSVLAGLADGVRASAIAQAVVNSRQQQGRFTTVSSEP